METIRAFAIGFAALLLTAVVPGVAVSAGDAGRHDHWQVVAKICQTGVTPEAAEGHKEFVAALEKEGTTVTVSEVPLISGPGTRRITRLVRPLESAYLDCFQGR